MNRLGHRRRFMRGAFIASASLISIATASPAFAQGDQAPASQPTPAGDQEVVVTAQFRTQRLQDTPLAITAIPSQLLEQRAASLLPGLLLARVDGKSPVEYLTQDSQKNFVRAFATTFLQSPPARLADITNAWQKS